MSVAPSASPAAARVRGPQALQLLDTTYHAFDLEVAADDGRETELGVQCVQRPAIRCELAKIRGNSTDLTGSDFAAMSNVSMASALGPVAPDAEGGQTQ